MVFSSFMTEVCILSIKKDARPDPVKWILRCILFLIILLSVFDIHCSGPVSVFHQLHIRKTLDILFELGETVISHLKVTELQPDTVSKRAQGDPVAAVAPDLLKDVFFQHLFFALVFIEGD